MYGWSQSQMGSLVPLWNQESGWSANAVNPSSGAYGIPQALPSVWGHPYALGDYKNQVIWGLNYIRSRYGSPAAAEAHELSAGWYGSGLQGGIFSRPTLIGVGERGPERVDVTPVGSPRHRGGQTVVLQFRPAGSSDFDRFMMTWLKRSVTTSGGGNVQVAFGSGT
jgi:SLT domain-containing protein